MIPKSSADPATAGARRYYEPPTLDTANPPPRVNRRDGAVLLRARLGMQVSPRTLETWPLPTRQLNGRATYDTAELLEHGRALLANADGWGGRRGPGKPPAPVTARAAEEAPAVQIPAALPELVTTAYAAGLIGVSIPTLERWRRAGEGPRFERAGRQVRYRRAEVERWLDDGNGARLAVTAPSRRRPAGKG